MANADMCLEAARKAFPNNKELRVAYMIGFNEGFDRAMEQPEVDLEKELIKWYEYHFKKKGIYEEYSGFYLENSSQLNLARHFYELGLNARKEE